MEINLDYGILSEDPQYTEFTKSSEELKNSIITLDKVAEECAEIHENHYDKLTKEDRIELNLFMLYATNSIYWMMLCLNGVDPSKGHPIKSELERIKKTMLRWKQVKDLKLRPTVDKDAAKRFIRSGLWDPKSLQPPANKKIKFDDDK